MVEPGVDTNPAIEGTQMQSVAEAIGVMSAESSSMNETMKDVVRGITQATNSMTSMIEATYRGGESFNTFNATIEKTSVSLKMLSSGLTAVSYGMRSATQGTEGLISTLSVLSTKTMPNLIQAMSGSFDVRTKEMNLLKEEAAEHRQSLGERTKSINMAKEELKILRDGGVITDDEMAKEEQLQNFIKKSVQERTREGKELQDTTEDIKDLSMTLGKAQAKISTALGVFAIIATATIALAQAYDNSIKAKREVIYTLGRLGVSYSKHVGEMDAFDKAFTGISTKWGILREDMAKALGPLASLGVGVGATGAADSLNQIKATMVESADFTGMMMRGFGVEAGVSSKLIGTLSTTFDLTGKSLGESLQNVAVQGSKSALGMQRYINELTSMIEMTRRFGGSQESAILMLNTFGGVLKQGVIGLDQLARITTSSMWSPEQQGAVASMVQQYAPKQAEALGINGMGVMDAMYKLQETSQKQPEDMAVALSTVISKIIPAGAGKGTEAYMSQQLLQQLTGAQVPLMKAAGILGDPEALKALMAKGTREKKTIADLMKEGKKTYAITQTYQEKMIVATETIRDIMVKAFGGPAETAEGISAMGKKDFWKALTGAKEFIVGEDIANHPDVKKDQAERLRQRTKKALGKQTGGYISETAMYMLHAGEQVMRPGESGGGVSISLGGMSINVGNNGDMRSQVNEAFDRIKRETIMEIEAKWNEALISH